MSRLFQETVSALLLEKNMKGRFEREEYHKHSKYDNSTGWKEFRNGPKHTISVNSLPTRPVQKSY